MTKHLKTGDTPKCRKCGIILVPGENTPISQTPKHNYICRTCKNILQIERGLQNKLTTSASNARRVRQYKLDAFSHYGSVPFKCVRCGFSDDRALTLDHIYGGGMRQRRQTFSGRRMGNQFYRWLKYMNWPPGLQILCMNCQFIKRMENGELRRDSFIMPHKEIPSN